MAVTVLHLKKQRKIVDCRATVNAPDLIWKMRKWFEKGHREQPRHAKVKTETRSFLLCLGEPQVLGFLKRILCSPFRCQIRILSGSVLNLPWCCEEDPLISQDHKNTLFCLPIFFLNMLNAIWIWQRGSQTRRAYEGPTVLNRLLSLPVTSPSASAQGWASQRDRRKDVGLKQGWKVIGL